MSGASVVFAEDWVVNYSGAHRGNNLSSTTRTRKGSVLIRTEFLHPVFKNVWYRNGPRMKQIDFLEIRYGMTIANTEVAMKRVLVFILVLSLLVVTGTLVSITTEATNVIR